MYLENKMHCRNSQRFSWDLWDMCYAMMCVHMTRRRIRFRTDAAWLHTTILRLAPKNGALHQNVPKEGVHHQTLITRVGIHHQCDWDGAASRKHSRHVQLRFDNSCVSLLSSLIWDRSFCVHLQSVLRRVCACAQLDVWLHTLTMDYTWQGEIAKQSPRLLQILRAQYWAHRECRVSKNGSDLMIVIDSGMICRVVGEAINRRRAISFPKLICLY